MERQNAPGLTCSKPKLARPSELYDIMLRKLSLDPAVLMAYGGVFVHGMWPPVILFPLFVQIMLIEGSGSQKEALFVVYCVLSQSPKVEIAPNAHMRLAKKFAIVGIFLAFKSSLYPPSPIYFTVGTSLQYTSTYKGNSFSSWLLHEILYLV